MTCYGLPLRGKQAARLKATVRSVTSAPCLGLGVPSFWRAMGLEHQYQLVRVGQLFTVVAPSSHIIEARTVLLLCGPCTTLSPVSTQINAHPCLPQHHTRYTDDHIQ